MRDDMGTFRVDVEIENPARPGDRRTLPAVLVDTGAELSWVPADLLDALGVQRHNKWLFRQADGTLLERWTGGVFIHVAGKVAGDEVVFGEPGDLVLLGSRTLEGLNFRVEPVTKRLVDAGPAPAAVALIAPGAGPVGESGVSLQQVVDVRAEAELADEQRGERHDQEPLKDVGRRPPPLEQGEPRGQHEHRRHALSESPRSRCWRERRSPAPSRDEAVVKILERVCRRHQHVEPQDGRQEQEDRRRLREDPHQHHRSHDGGLELQALEAQGRAIGRLRREPLLLHEVHHG